mgnify:CR=1 FL=1
MDSTFHVVAIDGGAGTGKSTTASLLSKRLNFLHVDTGSHYRSVTVALMESNVSPEQASNPGNLNKFKKSPYQSRHIERLIRLLFAVAIVRDNFRVLDSFNDGYD